MEEDSRKRFKTCPDIRGITHYRPAAISVTILPIFLLLLEHNARVIRLVNHPMPKTIRIGNAQGFWGDSVDAPRRLVEQAPDLDYLTLDYLAEVSLSIMAIQQQHTPDAGYEYARTNIECLGASHAVKGVLPEPELLETVLRIGGADPRKEAVERFAKELMPLVCGGPQGTTGYQAGRPRVSPVFGYWPCLIEAGRVPAHVEIVAV